MKELRERVLSLMGMSLLTTQNTELFLKTVVDITLPKGGEINTEEYLKRLKDGERRTLGTFISLLRARSEIDPSFDEILTNFLKMRNDFIHDVSRIPGFGITSEKELLFASEFLEKFLLSNDFIQNIMAGIVRSWEIQNDFAAPGTDYSHKYFKEIDSKYIPIANHILSSKESKS